MRHATILVAILAFVPLASATAQVPVRPGARVRVTRPPICRADTICGGRPPRQSVGAFLAWKADTLVFQSNGDTLSVPVDLVTRLDVYMGRKRRTGDGAIIGAALLGGLMSFAALSFCESYSCSAGEIVRVVGSAAAIGAGIGALIGSAVETDRWVDVPLDRLRVSLGPQRDGRFGLGASVRF